MAPALRFRFAMSSIRFVITTSATAAILSGGLAAPPALAQSSSDQAQTREAVLGVARTELATQSAPPTRSTVERGLYWYDNQYVLAKIFGGWKGFRIGGGDFPAGAGMKFGVAYDRPLTKADPDPTAPNRVALVARGAYSTRGYVRARAGIEAGNLGGRAIDVSAFGQYYEFPQEDYFGTGMGSLESDRTNYLLDVIETGGAVHWRPYKLDFAAGGSYVSPRVGSGTDSLYASTEDVFGAATTPGLGTQTDFIKVEASAAFDWRDNPSYPHSGGRYEVKAAQFDDHDLGQFDFYRVDVHLQHYIPLASRYRVLAFRTIGAFTTADTGQSVPFYLQPTLGGHRDLRGYRESRFRDNNTFLLGAEYRWQAWWALDGAFFVDAGTVAPTRQDLSLRNTEVSYGVGFRFHSNSALVGRLDLAFSKEGFIPLLRFEHVF
jgi:Omp85 superfamily domain